MNACSRIALWLALLAGAPGSSFAQTELEPGNWKLHVVSTSNGAPEPVQDTQECLQGDQLKDLGSYFAPELEGAEADCKKTRQPASDPKKIEYRMRCTGSGFTVEATTTVTIESPRRFTAALRIDSRAEAESALVVADVAASWTGACKPPPPEAPPAAEPRPAR